MGERVVVQFEDSKGNVSPACYMNWDGQRVGKYIRECAKLMEGLSDDLSYAFARFVGICHTHVPGNISLGVWNQTKPLTIEASYGDAGCYIVNCATWEVRAFGGYGKPFNALEPASRVKPKLHEH